MIVQFFLRLKMFLRRLKNELNFWLLINIFFFNCTLLELSENSFRNRVIFWSAPPPSKIIFFCHCFCSHSRVLPCIFFASSLRKFYLFLSKFQNGFKTWLFFVVWDWNWTSQLLQLITILSKKKYVSIEYKNLGSDFIEISWIRSSFMRFDPKWIQFKHRKN